MLKYEGAVLRNPVPTSINYRAYVTFLYCSLLQTTHWSSSIRGQQSTRSVGIGQFSCGWGSFETQHIRGNLLNSVCRHGLASSGHLHCRDTVGDCTNYVFKFLTMQREFVGQIRSGLTTSSHSMALFTVNHKCSLAIFMKLRTHFVLYICHSTIDPLHCWRNS